MRRRHGKRTELLDARSCDDCGMALVEAAALATKDSLAARPSGFSK
jgi:hypothetical protein